MQIEPAAERLLCERGFMLAVDFGSSALFVLPRDRVGDPVALAHETFAQLGIRSCADPRVQIGVCVHRDEAPFVGADIQPCPLLRPATWQIPESVDGVHVTERLRSSR